NQVISHLLNDLEIICLPGDLPASIDVDLIDLDENGTITLEDIQLPQGVTYAGASTDPNPTLVTALTAREEIEEEDDELVDEPELVDADEEGDEEQEEEKLQTRRWPAHHCAYGFVLFFYSTIYYRFVIDLTSFWER